MIWDPSTIKLQFCNLNVTEFKLFSSFFFHAMDHRLVLAVLLWAVNFKHFKTFRTASPSLKIHYSYRRGEPKALFCSVQLQQHLGKNTSQWWHLKKANEGPEWFIITTIHTTEMPPEHWWAGGTDHLSRKPVPVFDLPLGKKLFPNVQSEPLPDKPCISLNVLSWWSDCLLQIHFYNLICHQTPPNKVQGPIPRRVGILLRNSIKLSNTKKCYFFVNNW